MSHHEPKTSPYEAFANAQSATTNGRQAGRAARPEEAAAPKEAFRRVLSCDLSSDHTDHTHMAPFSPDTVVVVTGSSRGLGLEFVKQLLENSQSRVVATARNPTGSKGLAALTEQFADRLKLVALDTSDESGIRVCTLFLMPVA